MFAGKEKSMFKKGFLIELDDIPNTDEDICREVQKYCKDNELACEIIDSTTPIVAKIGESKYEVTKKYQRVKYVNCWVLNCKEI